MASDAGGLPVEAPAGPRAGLLRLVDLLARVAHARLSERAASFGRERVFPSASAICQPATYPSAEVGIATNIARPLAWYSNGGSGSDGDIADVCLGSAQATIAGHAVATGWSQVNNSCISSTSTLNVCDGSATRCRECSAADNGQPTGCTGSKALCETDEGNPAFGECVACATSAQCSGTTPVCNKADAGNDTCRACASDVDCTGSAAGPHCLATGACGPAPAAPAGSGASSGCSATGSGPAVPVLWVLALLALVARRRPLGLR